MPPFLFCSFLLRGAGGLPPGHMGKPSLPRKCTESPTESQRLWALYLGVGDNIKKKQFSRRIMTWGLSVQVILGTGFFFGYTNFPSKTVMGFNFTMNFHHLRWGSYEYVDSWLFSKLSRNKSKRFESWKLRHPDVQTVKCIDKFLIIHQIRWFFRHPK